jgi:hypothetical protein
MAMGTNLGAPGAGKLFLSHVNACAIEAVCLLMIDALSFETLMKLIQDNAGGRPWPLQ